MKPDLSGSTILLVEDEYLIASELDRALQRAGANVLGPARDLETARQALLKGAPDVAVLDVKLHANFVYDLADELVLAGVPLVFATGFDCEVLPERFRAAPCHEKPVSIHKLTAAVERQVRMRQQPTSQEDRIGDTEANRSN